MECILMRWEARTRTIVRQIAKSADFVRTWPDIWRHDLMTWHDIDLKFLQYVSNWPTRGYCKFRGDPPRFAWVICEKPWGSIRTPPPTSARVKQTTSPMLIRISHRFATLSLRRQTKRKESKHEDATEGVNYHMLPARKYLWNQNVRCWQDYDCLLLFTC